MANRFANHPNVKLDCSKCKGYIAAENHDLKSGETNSQPEHDAVNSPAHYTSGGIECIDCIKAALGENFIGFLIGNVFKYCYRYRNKNGLEDLKKAQWYLNRAIKELQDEQK